MANAVMCDNCGTVLGPLNRPQGDDENGEAAAWIRLSVKGENDWADACTRQCAHELLDGAWGVAVDDRAEGVAVVARTIREYRQGQRADDDV